MSNGKVMNRWLVVAGAVLMELCLGAIYGWSVFTPYLTGAAKDPYTKFGFTNTQAQTVFSVGLATFAVVMILAGRWQAKAGPRVVSLVGGVLLGTGYILAHFIGTTLIGQVISIGLVGGAGIGFAYVCPIAVGMKWFPNKKGFITGLAVAGFGFGSLIWIKLADTWGHLISSHGVLNVFLYYGIAFMALVVLGALTMVNPPAGWMPAGWTPATASSSGSSAGHLEFSSK